MMKLRIFSALLMTASISAPALAIGNEVTIAVHINPEAGFRLMFVEGDHRFVPDQSRPEWSTRNGDDVRTVTVPLSSVNRADRYCVQLGNGWIVRDSNGHPYQISCDSFDPTEWLQLDSGPIYYMDVERGSIN